tara:strand:- start:14335 stop:14655 length:321 start_codon:yes stop_codon:yes gene_type:complete
MDIAGYDSWRLAGPYDEAIFDFDEDDLLEGAEQLAEEMLDTDPFAVEEILMNDDTWQIVAINVAAGTQTALQLEITIRELIVKDILKYSQDDVESYLSDRDDGCPF